MHGCAGMRAHQDVLAQCRAGGDRRRGSEVRPGMLSVCLLQDAAGGLGEAR